MIEETFLHLTGVGPVTEQRIRAGGVSDWHSALERPEVLPFAGQRLAQLIDQLQGCRAALEADDIGFLVNSLVKKEQWRILGRYFERTTFFDIETSDLSYDAYVTVIVAWHQGKLLRFVHGENLDEFLDLLDEVELLVSFNGATFDIPQVLRTWNIHEIPCPHIDLRWQCYHCGWRGGLKQIERKLGITRPEALRDVDGHMAVWLWRRWKYHDDKDSLDLLVYYCGADVITLPMLVERILAYKDVRLSDLIETTRWEHLESLFPERA